MTCDFRLGDWLVQPDQCRVSSRQPDGAGAGQGHGPAHVPGCPPWRSRLQGRLLDDVWGSQAVSESALTRTVTELRQALGDSADASHLLETIPKHGYRLIGSVVAVEPAPRPAATALVARPRCRRGTLVAAGAALILGVAALAWLRGNTAVVPIQVAVLPFDHIGVEPGREYLADGLAEDTIVSLGMIGSP